MLAATGVDASSSRGTQIPASRRPGIKLAEVPIGGDDKYQLARQMGITHAVVGAGLSRIPRQQYMDTLEKIRAAHDAMGMKIAAFEGGMPSKRSCTLGLDDRDEEIQNWIAALEAISKVGIPVVLWDWVAGPSTFAWVRTKRDAVTRGGALTSEFDNSDAKKLGLTESGEVSRDKMWETVTYFLKAVIPVAEKYNVRMALHPNDPPLSPLRGIGRIATSAADFRRIMDIVPSPVNGITFCQANFSAMTGDNVYDMATEFCKQKKIFFVHFRNIDGDREHFLEKFHDDGQIDMPRMMKIYHDYGFDGPMRPDHAPIMVGEKNDRPGYGTLGKIFAFGYMIGILQALQIPYE
jgi:mannonate dehydratase